MTRTSEGVCRVLWARSVLLDGTSVTPVRTHLITCAHVPPALRCPKTGHFVIGNPETGNPSLQGTFFFFLLPPVYSQSRLHRSSITSRQEENHYLSAFDLFSLFPAAGPSSSWHLLDGACRPLGRAHGGALCFALHIEMNGRSLFTFV